MGTSAPIEEVDVEALRALLLERRERLRAQGDVEIAPNRTDPTAKPDEDAQPLNEMNQVIASRRNKQRALELRRVETALERMEQAPEDFGYCLGCEEPIPHKRLKVMPWALYCVTCQEARAPARGQRRRHALDFID